MQFLRQNILLAFAVIYFSSSFSQDKIYMGIGTQSGKITGISADAIRFNNAKGAPSQVSVKDVFLLFNGKGGYMVPYKMDFSSQYSKDAVNAFLNPPVVSKPTDCIYTLDGKLIKGLIVKENKKSIYINDNGNNYDMDISRVAAVVYKDGRHSLISALIIASDILWAAYQTNEKNENNVKANAAKNNAVAAEPAARTVTNEAPRKEDVAIQKKEEPVKKQAPVTETLPQPVAAPAPPVSKLEDPSKNVNREEFEKKALDKVAALNRYLKVLCDKTAGYEKINQAVDLAVGLFVSEESTVETVSLNSNDKMVYKIKAYLRKAKFEKYDKVDIEWTKLQYVSNFKKGPDGNYYGTISFEQLFRGYKDGKVMYEDITVKTGEIILKAYEKLQNGISVEQWDVFLGDISVKSMKGI